MRMGDGKRGRSQQDHQEREGESKNLRRRWNDSDTRVGDELVVYRILCPNGVIGSVIGKSGKVINSIRHDTKATVKVVDAFPGVNDRVITIYCYLRNKGAVEVEVFDDLEPLCPAQDALLKVHAVIAKAVATLGDSDKRREGEECRVLVPSSQLANIIGKSGSTIKRLRSKTRANIKFTAKDVGNPAHACAMEFDNFILIAGEPEAVKKALFAVSAIMFKFSPKEEIPLGTIVPEAPPTIIIPSDLPIYRASGLYPAIDHSAAPGGLPPVLGATPISNLPGYADAGSSWPIYSSALPVVSRYGITTRSEELTFGVLCPSDKIGRVIGKGGSTIKSMRQTCGARIEVDDIQAGGGDECLIIVTSVESPDDLKSMSSEAVLLLQEKINDKNEETVTIRLLVSAKVIGCIIGRSGSIVNEIRKRTQADIRISKGRKPKCAGDGDELVEVVGRVVSVREALIQIVLRLRDDLLKEKESDHNSLSAPEPIYTFPVSSIIPNIPPVSRSSYEHGARTGTGLGMISSGSFYVHGSLPTRNDDYGSFSSQWSKQYRGSPPPLTLEMVVPGHAVGKVLGKGGANIANIRKISGAFVEISDSKSSRGDCVAFISGTSEQKRSAENLIQAFIMAT